jgi:hypothetical protein
VRDRVTRWVAVTTTITLMLGSTLARADDAQDAQQLVEKAKPVTPTGVVVKGAVKHPQAAPLLAAVAKLAGGR